LQDALDDTLFDMHKLVDLAPQFAEIKEEEGETYINIRIPVSRRLD
jgi:hypothetical protein